ncbi:MAG TPA: hypothetical protein VE379_09270 [Vicinamibacterales bacterium]|nr:hypothetical protein [Vicinamibacterales bacterium]
MVRRLAALLIVALLTPSAVHAACALSCAWPGSQAAAAPEAAATCHDQTTPTDSAAMAGSATIHCQDGAEVAAFALRSRWAPDASPLTLFDTLLSAGASSVPDLRQHPRLRLTPPPRTAPAPLRI